MREFEIIFERYELVAIKRFILFDVSLIFSKLTSFKILTDDNNGKSNTLIFSGLVLLNLIIFV